MLSSKNVEVLKEFPFDYNGPYFYGSRAVLSLNEKDLSKLAKDVWDKDEKKHHISFIYLTETKEFDAKGTKVFYADAQGYISK